MNSFHVLPADSIQKLDHVQLSSALYRILHSPHNVLFNTKSKICGHPGPAHTEQR